MVHDPSLAVLPLADQVRARLARGELAGLPLAGGPGDWLAAERLAQATLLAVEQCRAFARSEQGRVPPSRWHELAEQLRAIERAARERGAEVVPSPRAAVGARG